MKLLLIETIGLVMLSHLASAQDLTCPQAAGGSPLEVTIEATATEHNSAGLSEYDRSLPDKNITVNYSNPFEEDSTAALLTIQGLEENDDSEPLFLAIPEDSFLYGFFSSDLETMVSMLISKEHYELSSEEYAFFQSKDRSNNLRYYRNKFEIELFVDKDALNENGALVVGLNFTDKSTGSYNFGLKILLRDRRGAAVLEPFIAPERTSNDGLRLTQPVIDSEDQPTTSDEPQVTLPGSG